MSTLQFPTTVVSEPTHSHGPNRLLALLPAADYERIGPHLRQVSLTFKQILHKQGEHVREVYFLGHGACSITRVMRDGEAAEIATIGSEGVIGADVFFGNDQSVGETAVYIPDDEAQTMAVEPFNAEMERHDAFYNHVIRYTQALNTQIMQTGVCSGLHSAEQRCCRWLLTIRDRVKSDEIPLTHEFIASVLGVRRPTVTIIIGNLQQAGIVEYHRRHMTILDRDALERLSCECYETVKTNFRRLCPEVSSNMLSNQ